MCSSVKQAKQTTDITNRLPSVLISLCTNANNMCQLLVDAASVYHVVALTNQNYDDTYARVCEYWLVDIISSDVTVSNVHYQIIVHCIVHIPTFNNSDT